MNITTLMVAFLLQLHSESKLNIRMAEQIQDSPYVKKKLVDDWVNQFEWDLYVCMDEALDQFIFIEKQRRK